ncbi:hypothetical protein AJ79_01635 [Helicocarpus griseus UAMH5409]|uniref:Uncharacterized protein n=1 Tax=Helicocarpus griseus UAMH5409 TaxID=1447875 RepID=A0A2B7Y5M3_9EURO|nr:hypothetical protein AJ79_01635 [Helicocarpus griseus UAMH5409]
MRSLIRSFCEKLDESVLVSLDGNKRAKLPNSLKYEDLPSANEPFKTKQEIAWKVVYFALQTCLNESVEEFLRDELLEWLELEENIFLLRALLKTALSRAQRLVPKLIQDAAKYGNVKCYKHILEASFNPEPGIHYGTLLRAAARCSDVEVLRTLIKRGCDVNLPPTQLHEDGEPPLHCAIMARESRLLGNTQKREILSHKVFECSQALLEAGADISMIDRWGDTALHIAALHEHASLQLIDLLIEKGVEVSKSNGADLGITPLGICVFRVSKYPSDESVQSRYIDIASKLLEAGAHVMISAQGKHVPNTIIGIAASTGLLEIAKVLLKYGSWKESPGKEHFEDALYWAKRMKRNHVHSLLRSFWAKLHGKQ